jgi:hypothetical protein
VTVKELLGHSTIVTTMRYTHTNLDSKRSAVAKLEGFGDTLHQNAATGVEIVTKIPAKSSCKLYLKTEEWVSG